MKKLNLVYEYNYKNVDIVLVPNEVADHIDQVVQTFQDWLTNPQNSEPFARYTENGFRYLTIGTNEFVWWLNNICYPNGEKTTVLERSVYYYPEYPMADF